MTAIPHDSALDSSISLFREGYEFAPHRHHRFHSDIFRLRLMGEPAVCISGAEAAEVFYNTKLFQREGAIPRRIQTTLMGQNGVQTMDDAAHRHRKAMFMSVMKPASLHSFNMQLAENWRAYVRRWEQLPEINLFLEAEEVLCRTACAWAGIPFEEKDIQPLARDLSAMVDAFGGVGPRHGRGKVARAHAEKWISKMVEKIRAGEQYVREGSPLAVVSEHRNLDGELISPKMAAIELINLIRPTVAIAYFVTFEAVSLHEHPEWHARLQSGDDTAIEWFVQEVRRLYPFTPILGARVRTPFEWHGYQFTKGQMVLLDVHGTDHDARTWQDPEEFRPERFEFWNGSPYNFIPQGGSDHDTNHRCAGEWLTIGAMETIAQLLTTSMTYEVPAQDLTIDLTRMPTRPKSGFIMRQVRANDDVRLTLNKPVFNAKPSVAAAAAAAGCPFHQ
jgi:fatty-acid peroxygenase